MKPHLLKVINVPDHSFSVRQDFIANINNRWHYHEEVELIYFHKGSGTQFLGDSISHFVKGDIVLVGSNLPHYWKYDDDALNKEDSSTPYSTVIHFFENFWGDRFLNLPESKPMVTVLEKAKYGILVSRAGHPEIVRLIEKIYHSEGLARIITLLECLNTLAHVDNLKILSSIGFKNQLTGTQDHRIYNVYNFAINHFQRKITLEEISEVAGMTPSSFCRYFKSKTGKTFFDFLIEIRVGHACKLLIDDRYSIKQICFDSGFNNFSCFHKSFKLLKDRTPKEYQHAYLKNSL